MEYESVQVVKMSQRVEQPLLLLCFFHVKMLMPSTQANKQKHKQKWFLLIMAALLFVWNTASR